MSPVDRFGEPVEEPPEDEQSPAPPAEDPCGCDHGWWDRDGDQPRPCFRCRPHLAPNARTRIH